MLSKTSHGREFVINNLLFTVQDVTLCILLASEIINCSGVNYVRKNRLFASQRVPIFYQSSCVLNNRSPIQIDALKSCID